MQYIYTYAYKVFYLFIFSYITSHCVFDKIYSGHSCLVCTYWCRGSQYFNFYFSMVIFLLIKKNYVLQYCNVIYEIVILYRVTWKQKSNYEIKDQVVQRDVNTYFAFALIATISTVSKILIYYDLFLYFIIFR